MIGTMGTQNLDIGSCIRIPKILIQNYQFVYIVIQRYYIILFVYNNHTQVAKFTWGRLFALIGANEEEVGTLKYLIL